MILFVLYGPRVLREVHVAPESSTKVLRSLFNYSQAFFRGVPLSDEVTFKSLEIKDGSVLLLAPAAVASRAVLMDYLKASKGMTLDVAYTMLSHGAQRGRRAILRDPLLLSNTESYLKFCEDRCNLIATLPEEAAAEEAPAEEAVKVDEFD